MELDDILTIIFGIIASILAILGLWLNHERIRRERFACHFQETMLTE